MVGRQRQATVGLVVVLLAVMGLVALTSVHDGDESIATDAGLFARAGLTTTVDGVPAGADPSTTTSSTVAPVPAPTATPRPPAAIKAPATTTPAPRAAVTTSTTLVVPLAAASVGTTTAAVPATTSTAVPATTVDPCRNSTDSTCGPFHFDPQPGADKPMTVEVSVAPASPIAGQPVVFHLTLTDPDGVSYNGTNFNFGNSGIGGSTPAPCAKFGPWDPPARDPASATETVDVTHTYFEAGSYQATFAFDAGPFDCVDSVTGRGDRPYASSATGTVTVVVAPAS